MNFMNKSREVVSSVIRFVSTPKKVWGATVAGITAIFATTVTAFAAGNPLSGISTPSPASSSGPGAGLYKSLQPQIVPLFLLILGGLAVWYFVRHNHTKLVTLIITGTIVGVVLTQPQALGAFIGWVGGVFNNL